VILMTTHELVLRLSGDMAGFERGAAAVRSALDACAVKGRARYWVEVVFEELVTNIVRHGYADERAHDIDVRLTCGPDAIVLALEDDGQPFDPLQRPEPDRPASIEEATLGGLGILLVRKAATGLRYERTADGKNRLIVTLPAA
jgi:anti-sigma regulatory factor (Ser/Thr protein kinase)